MNLSISKIKTNISTIKNKLNIKLWY
jgi:hypothetical protein